MNTVRLDKIIISDGRVRKEFDQDQINNLAEDIKVHGLYHAILISHNDVDGFSHLVAGENRLRAIHALYEQEVEISYDGTKIPFGEVPIVFVNPGLSEDHILEIELNENLLRKDLSWQEQQAGIARLHHLRESQNPVQTMQATAKELAAKIGGTPAHLAQEVSDALILERHMDDPDVRNAPNKKAALKTVYKKAERNLVSALADEYDADNSVQGEGEEKRKSPHTILNMDCRTVMSLAIQPKYDLLITDPPYGVGADSFGDQAKTAHRYKDDEDTVHKLMVDFFYLLNDTMKPEAHAYMFCDYRQYQWLASLFTDRGWTIWQKPLIWYKGNSGMLPVPEYGPRNCHEYILYARRGNKRVVKQAAQDVLYYPDNSEVLHAAQKPVELYTDLISRSCLPGEKVVDWFCGSGPVFPAADICRVIATGCELDEEMFKIAKPKALRMVL